MNYSKKNIDELNIKEHLDASLDIKGISVSEDLINRTLAAVKKAQAETDELSGKIKIEERKRTVSMNRYIRSIAKVAAVVLVAAAGFAMVSSLQRGSKKMDMYEQNMYIARDDAAQEYASTTESTGTNEPKLGAYDAGTASGKAAYDAADDQAGIESYEEKTNEAAANTFVDGGDTKMNSLTFAGPMPVMLSIRDIFVPEPESIQSMTVKDTEAKALELTSKDEILEIYSILERYSYKDSSEAKEDDNISFTIEARLQDGMIYTMTIGSGIKVEQNTLDTSFQLEYELEDVDLLLEDIVEFLNKYK